MRRRRKSLALIEVVEVGSVFIDGLGAFLGLARNSQTHVRTSDRVASGMELLNAN